MLRSTLISGLAASVIASIAPVASLSLSAEVESASTNGSDCRCFPGDACWPSTDEWNSLNKTVNGRLIATIPLAAACHDDQYVAYDSERCAKLQNNWLNPETQ